MMGPFGGLAVALLLTGNPSPSPQAIHWERTFEDALKKARKSRRPVLVDFWAGWCGWCHRLDETTYVDPEVVRLTGDFIAVKVNTEGDSRETAVAARYDVESLPTILFLSPYGRPIFRVNGFQGPGQFPRSLEKARESAARIMGWEEKLDQEPRDGAALAALAVHLFDQESYEESRAVLRKAVAADAGLDSAVRKQIRLLLGIIETYDGHYAEAESVLREALAVRPIHDEYDPKVHYMLGKNYAKWGNREAARVVWEQILSRFAGSPLTRKAREALYLLTKK
jgi:thioredoxin-like negative regulator of GroEL